MQTLEKAISPASMQWRQQTAWVRRIEMLLLEVRQIEPEKFNWQVLDGSVNDITGDLVGRGTERTLEQAMAQASIAALAIAR